MSSQTKLADDFEAIRRRIAELEAEKKQGEAPKVQSDYSGLYGYQAMEDWDPA